MNKWILAAIALIVLVGGGFWTFIQSTANKALDVTSTITETTLSAVDSTVDGTVSILSGTIDAIVPDVVTTETGTTIECDECEALGLANDGEGNPVVFTGTTAEGLLNLVDFLEDKEIAVDSEGNILPDSDNGITTLPTTLPAPGS